MFYIEDGREHFYQWDTDRRLVVEDSTIKEVHFCNRTGDCSLVCEVYFHDNDFGGIYVANVPNILLQSDWKIRVFAYDGKHTRYDTSYEVKSRTKPADYVYTETEVLNYNTLSERVKAIEEKEVDVDLSNYYTKAETEDLVDSKTCPGSMKIEYQPGVMIDLDAIRAAYQNGTYIYLVGSHTFEYEEYSDLTGAYEKWTEKAHFSIPLIHIDIDPWTDLTSTLYFGGSDNLGNGVSLNVGMTGLMATLDINLDCKYLPGGVDGEHDYATMEEVEAAINEALGVIENGTY